MENEAELARRVQLGKRRRGILKTHYKRAHWVDSRQMWSEKWLFTIDCTKMCAHSQCNVTHWFVGKLFSAEQSGCCHLDVLRPEVTVFGRRGWSLHPDLASSWLWYNHLALWTISHPVEYECSWKISAIERNTWRHWRHILIWKMRVWNRLVGWKYKLARFDRP